MELASWRGKVERRERVGGCCRDGELRKELWELWWVRIGRGEEERVGRWICFTGLLGWSVVVLVGGGKCCGTLLSQHTTILTSTSSTKGTSDNGQNWVRQPCPQPGKPRSLPVLLIDRRPSTWRELGPALNRPPYSAPP